MGYYTALTTLGGFLALALSSGLAAGAEHDPAEVLRRVTAKILAAGERIPNYTCVETVNRDFFRPEAATLPRACALVMEERQHPGLAMVLHPHSTDRLRLDVAMMESGEIFSWVGASRFDDAWADHLADNGPLATGAFAGYLAVVFGQDSRTFTFEKNTVVDGRSLMQYSFAVEAAASHYRVRAGNLWVFVAYDGTIQVDPHTEEVVGMTVRTLEMPAATNVCQTTTTVDFGTAHIGGVDFPLATRTLHRFLLPDGEEMENTTTFVNCREYKGESAIRFDEGAPGSGTAAGNAPSSSPGIPAGLRFTLELTEPIPTDTAAAGDPFVGKLVEPLRDGKRTWAPAGAFVQGRLLRVQSVHRPPTEVILVLKPESVENKGSKLSLAAVRDWTQPASVGTSRKKQGIRILLPLPGEERAGIFEFAGQHIVVKKGFRSDWRTVSAGTGK
jgi:hypothetical protein